MALLKRPQPPKEDHGTDLLTEFQEILDNHSARSQRRGDVVKERLASLEAEQKDLRALERKHQAARDVL